MNDYLLLFVGTVLVNNFVLVKFLGLSVYGGFQTGNRDGHGAGNNVCDDAGVYLRLAYRYVDFDPT